MINVQGCLKFVLGKTKSMDTSLVSNHELDNGQLLLGPQQSLNATSGLLDSKFLQFQLNIDDGRN